MSDLNTTLVKVQLLCAVSDTSHSCDLNTTLVKVQHRSALNGGDWSAHLNTTLVKVQLTGCAEADRPEVI